MADNTVCLAPADEDRILRLLDLLDQGATTASLKQDIRRAGRTRYRSMDVTIRVFGAHDTMGRPVRVPTRNISIGGLAFLHKQMLAPDQRLRIDIPLLDDRTLHVIARVIRCRHVEGMMHEIGVKFIGTAKRG